MCFWIRVLIVISLLSCEVCGQVDCSTANFTSPPPTCPGDQLLFYCSTSDTTSGPNGITTWRVNDSATECILLHALWPTEPNDMCALFQAQASGESPENCFTSTFNGTASLSLDGVEVACYFVLGTVLDVEVGRGAIYIVGPVGTTGISCGPVGDGSNPNTRNLTITWTTVEDFPNETSNYVVSVLPLEQTGTERVFNITPESSEFTNKQLEVEVEMGTEYQITVRADNCGDQQEGNSVTIPVFNNVPLPPQVGSVRSVGRNESGGVMMYALDITIRIIDPTISCAVGPIETFTMSFNLPTLGGPVVIRRDNDMYCNATAQECSYTHVFPPGLSVSQFDVEVTASNVAGGSPTTTHTIDSIIVSIKVCSVKDPRNVTVTLSEGLNDSESCSFQFGRDSTYATLPSGGVNRNISDTEVIFFLSNLLNNTVYYYNVSCEVNSNTTSVIQGRFRSSCSGDDLVEGDTSNCSAPVGYMCLVIEDGVSEVIYNETVAVYRVVSSSYCIESNAVRRCMCDGNWDGMMPSFQRVVTDQQLEAWQIAVIVIGLLVFVIGSSVCSVLGTLLVLRASSKTEGMIGVVMLVVSVITFPIFLISYCIVKKREWDENEVKLKPLYKLVITASVVITVVTVICWIVLIAYVASNEFYENGYLRGDDGVCVATDSDSQRVGRTVLVIVCLLLSLLVALEWCVGAAMWRWGTVDSDPAATEGTDSGKPPAKPKRSKKLKQKEAEEEQELQTYDTLQHGKTSSSPTPLLDPSDPTYGHLQQKGEGGDQADEYSHIQRGGKPKAVHNPEDPNYSHFKQGGDGGAGEEEYSQLNRGKGVSTLPGAVPTPSDPSYGKLKKEEEEPSEYDVVTNEPRHKPRKRDK